MAKSKFVKFQSKYENQVLCIKPSRTQIADGIAVPIPGKRITFVNGEFTTDKKDEIDFIRNHSLFGSTIVEVDLPEVQDENPQE